MSKEIKKFKLSTICNFNNYDSIVFKPAPYDQKLLEDPDGDLILLKDYKKLEQKYEEGFDKLLSKLEELYKLWGETALLIFETTETKIEQICGNVEIDL